MRDTIQKQFVITQHKEGWQLKELLCIIIIIISVCQIHVFYFYRYLIYKIVHFNLCIL